MYILSIIAKIGFQFTLESTTQAEVRKVTRSRSRYAVLVVLAVLAALAALCGRVVESPGGRSVSSPQGRPGEFGRVSRKMSLRLRPPIHYSLLCRLRYRPGDRIFFCCQLSIITLAIRDRSHPVSWRYDFFCCQLSIITLAIRNRSPSRIRRPLAEPNLPVPPKAKLDPL